MRLITTITAVLALAGTAAAQTDSGPAPTPAPTPAPKPPGRGDFDAGGQLRLPNGPDEMATFKTFNWVAVDARGKYYVLDWLTVEGAFPLAVKHPKTIDNGAVDPRMIGGGKVRFVAKLPHTDIAAGLGGSYMREGAMLLGDKDYPLYTGGFEPGFDTGLDLRVKLGSVVDYQLAPAFWMQAASMGSAHDGVQVPTSLVVAVGSLVKVSADVGLYTGDHFAVRGSKGGRLALGGALDVKIAKIIVHAGAGAASLLTGGEYPTIKDSIYFDLNVKFAK